MKTVTCSNENKQGNLGLQILFPYICDFKQNNMIINKITYSEKLSIFNVLIFSTYKSVAKRLKLFFALITNL